MILFVFEGQKREPDLYKTVKTLFLPKEPKDILCTYKSNIYSLYSKLKDLDIFENTDNSADTVSILNEILLSNNDHTLENIVASDISEIYLFFDYDFHHNRGDFNKNNSLIKEMLEYFNDETNSGKLYINYPMVDSIRYTKLLPDANYSNYRISRDKCNDFKNLTHEFSPYKSFDHILVSNNKNESEDKQLKHNEDVKKNWLYLIDMNLCKANLICKDSYNLPESLSDIAQSIIYINQLSKYVNTSVCEVSILNAFPIFIADYIGFSKIKNFLFF